MGGRRLGLERVLQYGPFAMAARPGFCVTSAEIAHRPTRGAELIVTTESNERRVEVHQ
jgi:hypothetical protein